MRLSEIICNAINEENAKKGIKTDWKAVNRKPTIIDTNGREHSIDGRFVREENNK